MYIYLTSYFIIHLHKSSLSKIIFIWKHFIIVKYFKSITCFQIKIFFNNYWCHILKKNELYQPECGTSLILMMKFGFSFMTLSEEMSSKPPDFSFDAFSASASSSSSIDLDSSSSSLVSDVFFSCDFSVDSADEDETSS